MSWSRFFKLLESDKSTCSPESYFHNLDRLYELVKMKHDTRDLGPLGIFYFLQRIRPEYPDLYDLHVFKVADKAFTWEFLFRDNVRDALLGRFREYPAKLRSKAHENQGKSCKMCRSQLGSGFDPWTRKRYLDGKGLFDFWESAIEGAGEEEE